MSAASRLRTIVRAAIRRKRVARELQDEWAFHVAERTRGLIADGVSSEGAEAQARREFGDPLRWKEQTGDVIGVAWFLDLQSDFKYALRQLRRSPGFAAVAITTLALGFGANTAIFSIVNGLLLRPLPVAEPGRLVVLGSGTSPSSTFAIWEEVRKRSAAFDGALAWSSLRFNLATSGEMEPVSGMFVSNEFFNVLGVPAAIGRTFVPANDVRGGGMDGAVAVISDRFWQRRFARSTEAIGASLTVEGVRFTIVGVTPPAFFGLEVGQNFDVAVPIATEPLMRGVDTMLDQRSRWWLNVMLRLKAEQSPVAAEALLRAAQPQIRNAAMPPEGPPQAARVDPAETLRSS